MASATWKLSHRDIKDVERVLETQQYASKRKATITVSLIFKALNTFTVLTGDKKRQFPFMFMGL